MLLFAESGPTPLLEQSLNVTENAGHLALLDRPLPPTPVKSDADYEVPTSSGSMDSDQCSIGENYEEIGSTSSADSQNDFEPIHVVPPKRYSKASSLKRYSETVQQTISAQGLLKKSALPSNQPPPRKSPTQTSFSPPLITGTPGVAPILARRSENVKKGVPKLSPFGDATASELRERFSQRREEACTTADPQSPIEVYEEVQAPDEVRYMWVMRKGGKGVREREREMLASSTWNSSKM